MLIDHSLTKRLVLTGLFLWLPLVGGVLNAVALAMIVMVAAGAVQAEPQFRITAGEISTIIVALLSFMSSALAFFNARAAARLAAETKQAVVGVEVKLDGRLTQLLEKTGLAERAAGKVEGIAEQAALVVPLPAPISVIKGPVDVKGTLLMTEAIRHADEAGADRISAAAAPPPPVAPPEKGDIP
jgi:hypothetical protein